MASYSVRRASGLHFRIERRRAVDLDRLQRGEVVLREQEQFVAYVGASGRDYILDLTDLKILASVSSVDWQPAREMISACDVDEVVIDAMVEYGLLESDQQSEKPAVSLPLWDEDALYFHQRTKWEGLDAGLPDRVEDVEQRQAASERFFTGRQEEQGGIPGHFHSRISADRRIELPLEEHRTQFSDILARRKTTRLFDTSQTLDFNIFSTILRQTFGCQGTSPLASNVTGLRKTSPSGGAMHPIEAYPMVLGVEGMQSGIYHYHVGDHALEPLSVFTEDEGRELARLFTAGQRYYTTAQVLVLYTARYSRNFWKYRRNPRAYKVVHLDLGHLSQTLYLLCADLGLGAFFTAACNEVDIEKHLEIDGISEAAIAIGGFGVPAVDGDDMGLRVEPYQPRN